MTVNELLQRLVELARDGKANWEIIGKYDHEFGPSWLYFKGTIELDEKTKEVELS